MFARVLVSHTPYLAKIRFDLLPFLHAYFIQELLELLIVRICSKLRLEQLYLKIPGLNCQITFTDILIRSCQFLVGTRDLNKSGTLHEQECMYIPPKIGLTWAHIR